MRVAPTITLTEEQRATLSAIARARSAQPARLIQRAKVILFAASGLQNKEIPQRIGASRFDVVLLAENRLFGWLNVAFSLAVSLAISLAASLVLLRYVEIPMRRIIRGQAKPLKLTIASVEVVSIRSEMRGGATPV